MKNVGLALLLSIGLLSSGCAHSGSGRARRLDASSTLVLAGLAVTGLAVIVAAGAAGGGSGCTDPLGRCGSYSLPPPESR